MQNNVPLSDCHGRTMLGGIAAVSAALLMTELALTRIFSVTMYYHFAFLAISIALFGLSASGVFVYVAAAPAGARSTPTSCCRRGALMHALATLVALACLVRIRVGLNYSPENLALMLAIYALAALPFFTGGTVMSLAFARLTDRINVLYAADLLGAAAGCLVADSAAEQARRAGRRADRRGAVDRGAAICFAPRARRAASAVVGRAPVRRRRGSPAGGRRAVRCRRHQRARGRPGPLQQVEFVLARRRVRPAARRLVAEPAVHRRARRRRCSWTSIRRRRRRSSRAPASSPTPRTCATS